MAVQIAKSTFSGFSLETKITKFSLIQAIFEEWKEVQFSLA